MTKIRWMLHPILRFGRLLKRDAGKPLAESLAHSRAAPSACHRRLKSGMGTSTCHTWGKLFLLPWGQCCSRFASPLHRDDRLLFTLVRSADLLQHPFLFDGLSWAKIAGHPLWPAWIATPEDKHNKPNNGRALELVQFFGKAAGTAWLLEKNWKRPYMQQRDAAIKQAKQVLTKARFLAFEAAVREADDHFTEMIDNARAEAEEENSELDDDVTDANDENQQQTYESEEEPEADEEMISVGDSSAMYDSHHKSSRKAARHDDNDVDDDNNNDDDDIESDNDDIPRDERDLNDYDYHEEGENQMTVDEKVLEETSPSGKENENEMSVEETVGGPTPSSDKSPEVLMGTPSSEKSAPRRHKSKKMSEIERLALSRNVSFRPSELVLADATSFAGIGCGRSRRRGGGPSSGGGASSGGNAAMKQRVPAFQVKDRIEAFWDGGLDLYAGTISDVSMDLAAGPIYKIK